jgi:hypothetical protein
MNRLVGELSAIVCRTAADNLDRTLEPLLQRVGELVAVDRVVLVEHDGADELTRAYRWEHQEVLASRYHVGKATTCLRPR